ncbi:MAG: AAA family ATPase [Deltaproteobacteria bacterium]|nr:AAA family ATPase [Deltaproteobacteria bacterium]
MEIVTTSLPFKDLRAGCLYIDKTSYIAQLLKSRDNTFFLQRPRRFGKSLLISTMLSVFEGESDLFQGLAIKNSNYDFLKYPTLRLDMFDMSWKTSSALLTSIYRQICLRAQDSYGLSFEDKDENPSLTLTELVMYLKKKTGRRVVILVDEYDAPILKALKNTTAAMKNAQALGDFYGTIKKLNQEGYIHFSFITGVSKFSMTSIFSGANVFTDISEKKEFANICGITRGEFDKYLEKYVKKMFNAGLFQDTQFANYQSFKHSLIEKYDGYKWNSVDSIFNPFSLLNAINDRKLDSYWFDSGTPTFLYKYIRSNPQIALTPDEIKMSHELLKQQTAKDVELVPLLYQTGYLTNARFVENGFHTLKIPNNEVRNSYNYLLTDALAKKIIGSRNSFGTDLQNAFLKEDSILLQKYLNKLIKNLKLYPQELRERIFHIVIITCLKTIMSNKIYSELKIDSGRPDIAFMLDESRGVMLELKSIQIKSNATASELKKAYDDSLNKAISQMKKYYIPLINELEADEIRGYALVVGWSHGVRVKKTMKVKRR